MRLILSCVACVFFSYAQAQSTPSIAEFKLGVYEGQTFPLSDTISVELYTPVPELLAKSLTNWPEIRFEQVSADRLRIEMNQRPIFSGEASAKHLSDSFVIDYSEDSIKDFASGFNVSDKQNLELSMLEAYVAEYIDNPTYENGFNIASVVATDRSGDCTEYAVLLTALARTIGLPARVVVGTILVEESESISAIGHAWVEIWHDQQWHIADAAMYQSPARQHFYLPAAALENEGPGYALSMARATALMPIKFANLKNAVTEV
jgi:transglutaminase-like putative cysteine protease